MDAFIQYVAPFANLAGVTLGAWIGFGIVMMISKVINNMVKDVLRDTHDATQYPHPEGTVIDHAPVQSRPVNDEPKRDLSVVQRK